jgi:hypothetical protein
MLHDILAERKPLSAVMCLKLDCLFRQFAGSMDATAGGILRKRGTEMVWQREFTARELFQ